MAKYVFACLPLLIFLFSFCNAEDPIVEVSQGLLRGRILQNRKGGLFYSFQSIPYAKPPLNELRFRAPVVAEGWEGVRDATQDLPVCTQIQQNPFQVIGSEDCLRLNVYTPQLPSDGEPLLPVMVFIHGGSFETGSAQWVLYSPEFLLVKDVILVVINYRVGILGFLSVEDENLGVPGNAGLKDQVMALEWLQANIQNFGGDPARVTIFGESAGGVSVHMQMLSPMAKGLFSQVIAQSGLALAPNFKVRNNGIMFAQLFGIQTDDLPSMLETLRNLPTESIAIGSQTLSAIVPSVYFPVPEIATEEPAFLPDEPLNIILNGDFNDVPFMVGYNDADGLLFTMINKALAGGQFQPITDFFSLIPPDLRMVNGTEEATRLAAKIKYFYYGDNEPTPDDIKIETQIYTDAIFGFTSYRVAREQLKWTKFPVYFYRFSADTELNFFKRSDPDLIDFPGAAHADELGYLFHNMFLPVIIPGSVEDLAIDRMVELWTNFAKFGDPSPSVTASFEWKPMTQEEFNFVEIATYESWPDVNPDHENMQFWSDVYEEFGPRKGN